MSKNIFGLKTPKNRVLCTFSALKNRPEGMQYNVSEKKLCLPGAGARKEKNWFQGGGGGEGAVRHPFKTNALLMPQGIPLLGAILGFKKVLYTLCQQLRNPFKKSLGQTATRLADPWCPCPTLGRGALRMHFGCGWQSREEKKKKNAFWLQLRNACARPRGETQCRGCAASATGLMERAPDSKRACRNWGR